MLRVRTIEPSSTPTSAKLYYIRCNGQRVHVGTNSPVLLSGKSSTITDEVGSSRVLKDEGSGAGRFKYVLHDKTEVSVANIAVYSPPRVTCGPGNPFAWVVYEHTFPGVYKTMRVSDPYVGYWISNWHAQYPAPQEPSYRHYERWLKAKPSMSTRANMAVFLAELRDIKRMWDVIPKVHFGVPNWQSFLKWVNSQHLSWNFGWKPFIRDIEAACGGLRTFEPRLKQFIKEQNEVMVKHETETSAQGGVLEDWRSATPEYYKRVRGFLKTRFVSTFKFVYTLPPYDWETLRWRAFLDTLGLAATPSNVWALLPWSFVVDWFVNLGSYMSTYSQDWIEPYLTMIQCCSSVKSTSTIVMDFQWRFGGETREFLNCCTHRKTHYKRQVGYPSYLYSHPSDLSADKIRLLASLGGTFI